MAGPRVAQTTDHVLGPCPSCHQPVTAKVSVEIVVAGVALVEGRVTATTTSHITGVEVQHRCSAAELPNVLDFLEP